MESQVKICEKCSAVNSADAAFCRSCGAALPQESQPVAPNRPGPQTGAVPPVPPVQGGGWTPSGSGPYNGTVPPQNTYVPPQSPYPPYPPQAPGYVPPAAPYAWQPFPGQPEDIDGVPEAEMSAYLGQKSATYLPKFKMMSKTGAKTGFNVVVLLLGLFLGPFVAGFWFLHHKAYKAGAIICAIGFALSAISMACTIPFFSTMESMITAAGEERQNGGTQHYDDDVYWQDDPYDYDYGYDYGYGSDGDYYEPLPNGSSDYQMTDDDMNAILFMMFGTSIVSLAHLGVVLLISFKANYWFKQSAVQRIGELKRQNPEAGLQQIANIGGVNPISWVILLVLDIMLAIALAFGVVYWLLAIMAPYL